MARSGPVLPSNTGAVGGAVGTITISPTMPISGVFGGGNVAVISSTKSFIVPATTIRVRMWAGGSFAGAGFTIKVISGLTIGAAVTATIGLGTATNTTGGTTSFGAHCSATGGTSTTGGTGVGGDVNTVGGSANTAAGGGAANLLGNGGDAGKSGTSGGGGNGTYNSPGGQGGFGLAPVGGFSIDFLGCGSGSGARGGNSLSDGFSPPNGGNGGGGGYGQSGSVPGGGGANGGANGLMVIEW